MSDKAEITVLDNGPYIVEGLEDLKNSNNEELELSPKVALCRCGASENKPYCDGAHKKIGFTDSCEKAEPKDTEHSDERSISVLHEGPLEVSNAFMLNVKDEMHLSEDNPYYLCRCGASENKPFCDGSHKKIGFSGE